MWLLGEICNFDTISWLSKQNLNEGLTKQAMSPKFSSTILFCFLFLLVLPYIVNSRTNLSSKSFWADINFGTDTGSLSNNINYNKPNYHSIYFSKLVVERERVMS